MTVEQVPQNNGQTYHATDSPKMPAYTDVRDNRDQFGRVIHLYGDSISRGWALGTFAPPADHPLWALRSIPSTFALIAHENKIPDIMVYAGCAIDGTTGGLGTAPYCDPDLIRSAVTESIIRPGDVVVLQDAGPHGTDVAWYEAALELLRAAVTDRHDITLVMMTTADYPPACEHSQWDRRLDDGRTFNDAIRAVALAARPYPGQTQLLDVGIDFDLRRATSLATVGVDLMHVDGVHPNVWGQLVLVGHLLRACGLGNRVRSVEAVRRLVAANYRLLGYGTVSPTWSSGRARAYARWLLTE